MNEHIDDIAWQTGCLQIVTHDPKSKLHSGWIINEEKLTAFAQAIAEDCARIAETKYLYGKEANRYDTGFNIATDILVKYGLMNVDDEEQEDMISNEELCHVLKKASESIGYDNIPLKFLLIQAVERIDELDQEIKQARILIDQKNG